MTGTRQLWTSGLQAASIRRQNAEKLLITRKGDIDGQEMLCLRYLGNDARGAAYCAEQGQDYNGRWSCRWHRDTPGLCCPTSR